MAFRKENKAKNVFSKISIGLASPEEILANSSGEVLKPETINYRTSVSSFPLHISGTSARCPTKSAISSVCPLRNSTP